MIRIPAGEVRLWALGGVSAAPVVPVGAYLIDRREVTNREFAGFVAAGGYTREEFWKHPFRDGAQHAHVSRGDGALQGCDRAAGSRDMEARQPIRMARRTCRSPASVGTRPPPTPRSPARNCRRSITGTRPTPPGDIQLLPGLVLSGTNHEGSGPRRADASGSMSAYGAIDMAGNVREWSANASDGSTRIALGGAWSDPAYQYLFPDVRSPFDRSAGNGLRCMKRLEKDALDRRRRATAPRRRIRDRAAERPVSDAEYAIFTRFFERRPVALEPRIESTDESSPHWIKQRVSFAAGYGHERMTALLYLPRSARPPYQVVIQMAGAATFYRRSSATEKDIFGWSYAEYLIRGGRAVMIPIWKGSYERSDGFHPLQTEWPSYREHVIQWVSGGSPVGGLSADPRRRGR